MCCSVSAQTAKKIIHFMSPFMLKCCSEKYLTVQVKSFCTSFQCSSTSWWNSITSCPWHPVLDIMMSNLNRWPNVRTTEPGPSWQWNGAGFVWWLAACLVQKHEWNCLFLQLNQQQSQAYLLHCALLCMFYVNTHPSSYITFFVFLLGSRSVQMCPEGVYSVPLDTVTQPTRSHMA